MELHTLGVEGGYTQKDVQEVARAFTGWTIANPRHGGGFRFEPRMHDDGEKIVLGHKIKAGGGKKDGDQVLDLLATHPSTAQFIATKLARRFVADDPPKALVDRAATPLPRYRRRHPRGRADDRDVAGVLRAGCLPRKGQDAVRVRGQRGARDGHRHDQCACRSCMAVRNLGMPLYGCQPPTGYSDKAEAWVNSGALLNRMNFAVSLTASRQERGAGVRPLQGRGVISPAITSEALIASALAGELSETTAATVAKAATTSQALALVLGSPEFQRR